MNIQVGKQLHVKNTILKFMKMNISISSSFLSEEYSFTQLDLADLLSHLYFTIAFLYYCPQWYKNIIFRHQCSVWDRKENNFCACTCLWPGHEHLLILWVFQILQKSRILGIWQFDYCFPNSMPLCPLYSFLS